MKNYVANSAQRLGLIIVCRKKAFTLIELLVVIAIIALLLSIIIPSLRLAKEKAMNIACQNNLRQYGISAEMYLDESDGTYPNSWDSLFSNSPSGWCQWHDEENFLDSRPDLEGPLWPYLDAQEIHLCPKFKQVGRAYGNNHPDHDPSIPINPQYSYSMNLLLGPGYAENRARVRRPMSAFFFAEENMWVTSGLNGYVLNDNALCTHWEITLPLDEPPPFTDSFGFFHNSPNLSSIIPKRWNEIKDMNIGNTYAVFVDGHVEAVTSIESYRLARP